ncbi:MAG: PilX N-terminal domain-containing pilus assembly protein [Halopseudomonas sp.]
MTNSSLDKQQGITLIICMIVLVVLTIMGLASIRDTSMEEKMAGNLKNRNTAFQAAESGLRAGEQFLEDETIVPDFDGTAGLYGQMDDVLASMSASWAVSSARNELTDVTLNAHLASEPLYIIEQMRATAKMTDDLEVGKVQDSQTFYRVTTKAVGSTETTQVILQTVYKR